MCTNLTGLLLARSTDRRRETAIRLALGAGRSDLIRRSLVESGLLSLAGAAVALLLAQWLAAALAGWRPPTDVPLAAHVALDHRVLAYSLALAVLSTILVAFMPALQSTRTDVVPALKEETTRWRGGWHSRDIIVGSQMALSTALLVGALLVVRSLQHATTIDVGFNPRGAVSARVDLGLQGYNQERAREFQRRVRDEIAILPGIDSVAVANAVPLGMDVSTHTVYVEGQPEPRGSEVPDAIYYQVSPGFFRTLQTRLVAGRDFASSDTREATRVAVVNQAFAQLLGSGDSVGKRFRTGRSGEWIEVVGVVQDGKYQTLSEAPKPVAFHSGVQWYNPTTSIVARSSLPESEALDLVRQAVRRLDPSLSLFEDRPLSEILALPLLPARVAAALLGVFGALAIVLVLVGSYGLMSYGIAQRTRENLHPPRRRCLVCAHRAPRARPSRRRLVGRCGCRRGSVDCRHATALAVPPRREPARSRRHRCLLRHSRARDGRGLLASDQARACQRSCRALQKQLIRVDVAQRARPDIPSAPSSPLPAPSPERAPSS